MQRFLFVILITFILTQNKKIRFEKVNDVDGLVDFSENQAEHDNAEKMLELKLSRIRNIIPDDGEKLAQNLFKAYDSTLKYDEVKSISNGKPIISIDNSIALKRNHHMKGEKGENGEPGINGLKGADGLKGEHGLKGERGEQVSSGIESQKIMAALENKVVQNGNNILFFDRKTDSLEKTVRAQRDQILYQEQILKQLIKRLNDLGLNIY